ncbi:hypothetical protein Pla123a_36700 [Posidoniimonas polymericola]|uniref:Uncharacterized protein n=1 Tax=Posidoniimonas polymericola TaxID=2528002 RepID=A0A5C5YDH3_9BACT|nr:hypothetical protein Pla123a_36700 [Posidoniimonas polymericola]
MAKDHVLSSTAASQEMDIARVTRICGQILDTIDVMPSVSHWRPRGHDLSRVYIVQNLPNLPKRPIS